MKYFTVSENPMICKKITQLKCVINIFIHYQTYLQNKMVLGPKCVFSESVVSLWEKIMGKFAWFSRVIKLKDTMDSELTSRK